MIRVVEAATGNLVQRNGVGGIGEVHFVLLSPLRANAELGKEHEEVAPVLRGEYGIQIRICARVDGVEEDQKNFRIGHVDEGIAG